MKRTVSTQPTPKIECKPLMQQARLTRLVHITTRFATTTLMRELVIRRVTTHDECGANLTRSSPRGRA
jgi:hypothetical protein